jgi:hypothetical protein
MKKSLFPISFLIIASFILFVETQEHEEQSTADITQPKAVLEKISPDRQDHQTPGNTKGSFGQNITRQARPTDPR